MFLCQVYEERTVVGKCDKTKRGCGGISGVSLSLEIKKSLSKGGSGHMRVL